MSSRAYKNNHNNMTNLYAWKYDYKISKIADKVTITSRTEKFLIYRIHAFT